MNWYGANTGLGDYIHARKENYENLGIFRKGAFRGATYISSSNPKDVWRLANENYTRIKQTVQQNSGKGNISEIENFLTSFIGSNQIISSPNYNLTPEEKQKAIEIIMQTFQKNFHKELDINTLKPIQVGKSGALNKINSITGMLGRIKQQKKVQISTLQKYAVATQALLDEINFLIKMENVNQAEMQKLQRDKQEIYHIRTQLNKLFSQNLSSSSLIPIKFKNNNINSVGHLIEKIDALYRTYSTINTTELGAIGEIFAAAAAIATTGKIDKVTTDIIDKAIIGKMGSFTNMNITSNISTEFTSKDMIGMSITYDKNGKIYQAPKSQDTVDIQVDLGNSDNIFATNQLRASIKNYNNIYSPHGISIISGTNLLALLQLFDSSFGNHYLNRNVFYDKYSSDLDSLDELLKYGLAARALSGMRTMGFEKLSQYLIIYSRRQNRFFVYSTNTILDNLYHPGKGFNNTMVEVDGFDFRQKLKQNNEYIGSKNNPSSELAYQRISKVLAAARQSKLSMSLKFNK